MPRSATPCCIPQPLSAEAKEIQDRLQKAQKLLKADQEQAKQLSEQLVKAPESKQEAMRGGAGAGSSGHGPGPG